MGFEFNLAKSRANKRKHGIDFIEAQAIWQDLHGAIEVPVQTDGEARYLVIGMIESQYWTAVITHRRENIRLISVRRSRKREIGLYEENQNV